MKGLYISDLDGTLLLPDRTLGHRSRRAINRFVGRGGLFTVATGRAAPSAAAILDGVRLPLPAIVNNGALTVDLASGAPRRVAAMEPGAAEVVYSAAVSLGLTPVAYALDQEDRTILIHGPGPNQITSRYLDSVATHQPLICEDPDAFARRSPRCLSFILLDAPGKLEPLFQELTGVDGVTTSLGRSAYVRGVGVGEVQGAGADKAVAADALAAEAGLSREDAVAFGDNANDLPLLRWAREAYCPPDAADRVRASVAGQIQPCAEEGVAIFLEALMEGDMAPDRRL